VYANFRAPLTWPLKSTAMLPQLALYGLSSKLHLQVEFTEDNKKTLSFYSMELTEFDCSKEMIRRMAFTQYSEKGDMTSFSNSANSWEYIIPDSIGETLLRFVCKQKIKAGRTSNRN
jgi:hypothetical protein